MLSTILSLLKFVLWPSVWSVLENVLCIIDKNVCSSFVNWSGL
jgi:hypothetical protein